MTSVVVYADNDETYVGQMHAVALAQKLQALKLKVRVETPPDVGTDWNDVLAQRMGAAKVSEAEPCHP